MDCEILSIGTELLLGDIVNTNAQFLSKSLSDEGISVYYQSVVGDNPKRLEEVIRNAFSRVDMIITTGGLGPTKDDLTKETAFKYFGKKSVCHKESLGYIKEYFDKMGRVMSPTNEKQAYFPEDAIILKNNHGTAPGCIIEENGKVLIMLPGPPREMKAMFNESVIPYLRKKSEGILVSKVLRVYGVGEGTAAEMAGDLLDSKNPTVAPYAKDGEMIFRITAKAKDQREAEELIAPAEEKLRALLGDAIYDEGDKSLEYTVGRLLVDKKLTIATAESCTGGLVSSKLINYPGISDSMIEGIVTYSNESKMKRLGVKKETLDKYGAVSHQVAAEMAEGIRLTSGADIGISTTGIAGPGGGTAEKPVGLVYVGISYKGKIETRELHLVGGRQRVRNKAAMEILNILRLTILNN